MGSVNQESPFVGQEAVERAYGEDYNKSVARMGPEIDNKPRPDPEAPPAQPAVDYLTAEDLERMKVLAADLLALGENGDPTQREVLLDEHRALQAKFVPPTVPSE